MPSPVEVKRAKEPFQFMAASYLIRVGLEIVHTLGELSRALRTCSDASIFNHTFQSLETHHYVSFSSDFAQWVLAGCNEAALAERLAMLDLREIVSLSDLRSMLVTMVDEHLRDNPASADRKAFEPFHFCEARQITVPFGAPVWTLPEMADGIRRLGHHSLHYHFISSRLRLHLQTNDFSYWIEQHLGLPRLADRLNRIDFYNDTLDDLRRDLLALLDPRKAYD
jgi:hypothetical protein